jgi:hypothetical protein
MAKHEAIHSDSDLVRASICIDHEISKIGIVLTLLLESKVTIASPVRDQAIVNALLDSFLQATRNLCHFLYSYKPRSTDVTAEDFFDNKQEWLDERPDIPQFQDGSLASLISKRLAHLTWERVSGTTPSWGAFRIAWELCKAMEVFVEKAPSSRINPNLIEDVVSIKQSMNQIVAQYGGVDYVGSAPLNMIWNDEDLPWNLVF